MSLSSMLGFNSSKSAAKNPPTDWMASSMSAASNDDAAGEPTSEPVKSPKKKGKLQMLREGYEGLVSAVVRPPRSKYNADSDLGPKRLKLDSGTNMRRDDFTLTNYQGKTLECSIWQPVQLDGTCAAASLSSSSSSSSPPSSSSSSSPQPTSVGGGGAPEAITRIAVVYLHGNSSCRVDATRTGVLETIGPLNAALVAFDFAGSGLSEGDYVTLGWVSVVCMRERVSE